MASKQSSNAPKGPKRTRAKFPKVRTGCLTWIRHKKCDEAKPTCQRCRDYGYKCDGYESASEPRCSKQRPQGKPTSQAIIAPEGLFAAKRQSGAMDVLHTFNNLGDIHGSQLEKSIFFHLNQCTVKDLIGYSTSLTSFWNGYVLQVGHIMGPVRHALISLGASHKSYLLRRSANMTASETQGYDNLAIQQYNKAISGLTPIMIDPSPLDVQAILICCLIFVCVDNINGRFGVAVRHLKSGSDLLKSMQNSTTASIAAGAGTVGELTKKSCDTGSLSELSDMFERLGLDTSILVDDRLIHRQNFLTAAESQGPFLSSTAARAEMHLIDLDHYELYCSEYYEDRCAQIQHGDCEEAAAKRRPTPEDHVHDPDYLKLCDRFESWASRFDHYLEMIKHTPVSDAEFKEAMVLTLHEKIWRALLKEPPCCDSNPMVLQDYEDILSQAELVVPVIGDATHPIFSFEADTIPPVSFVASCCDDEGLQRRAIAMLRRINRTEGAWDSNRMADLCELELATGKCTGESSLFENMDCQGLCAKALEGKMNCA